MTGHSETLWDLDQDTLHEECGVFGIFDHADAGALSVLGLHALQHRGQEAAGIVSFDGRQFHSERHLRAFFDHPEGVVDFLPAMRAKARVPLFRSAG